MTSGKRILLSLAALVLLAGLPLASSDAPAARPAPAVAAAEPLVPAAAEPLGPPATAAQACPRTDVPTFFSEPEAAAVEACGKCSDAKCVGKGPDSVCGVGFRCIVQGSCTTGGFHCRCLII